MGKVNKEIKSNKELLLNSGNYEKVLEPKKGSSTAIESCGNYEEVVEIMRKLWKL